MLFIALPGEFDKFKLEGLIKDKGMIVYVFCCERKFGYDKNCGL